ncbi:hypothetical protein EDB86DRAFT_3078093 [Lactarius hatsudake]|nr:hypothetical protein EDB86DRAFT_3078093 [Lactarius hatsudake]
MEEDRDYALEVLTDHLHQTGPGIYASTHAPSSGTHPHSTVHTPSARPQGAPLDAQSEEQPTDPSPATLTERPSTLEEPARAPQPPQTDSLAAILAAVNAAISGLEARLTGRLDAQDKRIETLSRSPLPPAPNSTTPVVKGNKAKGKEAVAAPPRPNTSIPALDAREISRPVPRIDDPASHDRPEDIITPGAAASAAQTTTTQPTVLKEAFQPSPDKVIHLNLDSKGKPTPSTTMPPSWAKVTASSKPTQPPRITQQPSPPAQKGTQPLPGVGKKPNHAKTSGNTEVTVNRHRGLDDPSLELVIHKLTLAEIIAETRTEIDRLTGGKIALLSGRWSKNPKKHIHNFVYTFKGQIPFRTLYPLRDVLVKPLMVSQLVPNDGWVNAQIRETHTSDASSNVYTNEQLEMELRRNPAFEEAIFCIALHWQGSKHTVASNLRGTVAFAYVDEDGKTTTQAQQDGVFLFNEKTKFIPMHPRAPYQPIRSDATSAAAHITRMITPHTVPDHTTRSASAAANSPASIAVGTTTPACNATTGCPLKKGFAPPDLASNPTPITTNPHTAATAPPSAKGKAKATETEQLVATQREEPEADPSETPFTVVKKKNNCKTQTKQNKALAKQAANASVPGSSAYVAQPSLRRTAKIPARPIIKAPPTPPTWKEAPVIHKRHVATDTECATALRRIFNREPTADDLRSIHVAWGGHETDEEVTALWTLQFKWAVKYGLPLTVEAARACIIQESLFKEEVALKRFDKEWGPVGPRTYLFSTMPREQYFTHPGDLEEEEIPQETAQHNRNMARTLVQTIIQFKQLEAKTNGTTPPPVITEPIIEAVLNMYSHRGTYSFFGLASAGADDSIWNAITDMHASATTALDSYA